ncbi:MAG: N-formylglutamate deformylase [Alphaproteobacteria bacterium]
MEPLQYIPGNIPVIISMPHTGTDVPQPILNRFTPAAKQLDDTDWHIHRLYYFAKDMGLHCVVAQYSRYVIDLNRPPDDRSLYPGKFTTGLVPTLMFDGSPIYEDGQQPDNAEVTQRIEQYWQPYHFKLRSLIDELRARHGKVVLFDAHSIRSQVSTLFDGVLPDLNIGTADGTSCAAALADDVFACAKASGYSAVMNGRFKGGYITRHYGNPAVGVHTIQLELAQKNYMQEDYPFAYDEGKARQLQVVLQSLTKKIEQFIFQI